jgi:hypothetical protein
MIYLSYVFICFVLDAAGWSPREVMQRRTFVFKDLAAEHDVQIFYRSASILPYAVVPSTTSAGGRQSSPHPAATEHAPACHGERMDEGQEERPAVLDLELEEQEESKKREREREQEAMAAEEKPALVDATGATDQVEQVERPTHQSSDDHRVLFLLGGEVRLKNKRRGFGLATIDETDLRWSDFGGKREPADRDPVDTALREFDEETAGIFEGIPPATADAMLLSAWLGLTSVVVSHRRPPGPHPRSNEIRSVAQDVERNGLLGAVPRGGALPAPRVHRLLPAFRRTHRRADAGDPCQAAAGT